MNSIRLRNNLKEGRGEGGITVLIDVNPKDKRFNRKICINTIENQHKE